MLNLSLTSPSPRLGPVKKCPMQQNLAAHIVHCYERAQQAREKAKQATSALAKAGYLAAEGRWLALAQSSECQLPMSPTAGHPDSTSVVVSRMVRQSGVSFDDDVVALVTAAYHAVLKDLRLSDYEDAATRVVAKQVIDFAAQGERDPARLRISTLAAIIGT
jgi:hypothetical protein